MILILVKMWLFLCSKSEYDKILERIKKNQMNDVEDSDTDENEAESAYAQYMNEVISALIFYIDPKVDLTKILPNIERATKGQLKLNKIFFNVSIYLYL